MDEFKLYWNDVFTSKMPDKIVCDSWLDKYQNLLTPQGGTVLDIGCGAGNDTLYLFEKGFDVISCDYSEKALEILTRHIPTATALRLDITQPLPFANEAFDFIIADLSLHYFDSATTRAIMAEIRRVLKQDCPLIARVNSINDNNYGACQGQELDYHFYYYDGYNKRFFDLQDVQKYFSVIGTVTAHETDMLRYPMPKKVIEVVALKDIKNTSCTL